MQRELAKALKLTRDQAILWKEKAHNKLTKNKRRKRAEAVVVSDKSQQKGKNPQNQKRHGYPNVNVRS